MECLFCNIIDKKIPAYIIYEDLDTIVFLDIKPDYNGHLLVVPKKHFSTIDDIDETAFKQLLLVIKKMKIKLEERLNIDGLTVVNNNGLYQEIKHFHFHLKPAYKQSQPLIPLEEIYNILK